MITKEEIQQAALITKLSTAQVEKDYVLSWFLAGVSAHPQLSKSWVFKGGTCLRKIYIKDYRYSEDLDYTTTDKALFSINLINQNIKEVSNWVSKSSGIEIDTSRAIFEELHNPAGQNIIQGKIYYRGPVSPNSSRQWPRIKFDITSDEIIVTKPEYFKIIHPYSDQKILENYLVYTYGIYDLFSEKIRALFERTRPRDLYDVVEISKRFDNLDIGFLKECLTKKCEFKGILSLKIQTLKLEGCKAGWKDQLSHQLENLPDFEAYLKDFFSFYEALENNQPILLKR
jgi:predicted nucleotidyltransferase component of viral defense system